MAADEQDAWIRRFHPSPGAAAELVCFAYAGGTASYWRPLSARLAPPSTYSRCSTRAARTAGASRRSRTCT
ncbi:hypothetical protein NKH77_50075 [Streptomyces sp. M19]